MSSVRFELRIKKATCLINRTHPWIDCQDVFEIINPIEKTMKIEENDFEPLDSQEIIDIVCDVVKGI